MPTKRTKRGGVCQRAPDPSAEEIAERCAEIRLEWVKGESTHRQSNPFNKRVTKAWARAPRVHDID